VGDRVFVGPGCVITNVSFPRATDEKYLAPQGCTIEDDVKIGANVTLLPGVHIGRHALIGAGSVVTKDVPSFAIAFGNPARIRGDIRDLPAYQGVQ